jgi:CAF1 family ribonuclease
MDAPTWGEEFEELLPYIEASIKFDNILSMLMSCREASFVTIDCEFTGLKDHKSQIPKPQGRKQTIQERYQDVISHKVPLLISFNS